MYDQIHPYDFAKAYMILTHIDFYVQKWRKCVNYLWTATAIVGFSGFWWVLVGQNRPEVRLVLGYFSVPRTYIGPNGGCLGTQI